MGVRHGEISVFCATQRSLGVLNPDYDPCLFDWFPRNGLLWAEGKVHHAERQQMPQGVRHSKLTTVIIWRDFIQYQFWMQRAAQLQCVFPKSEKTGHEREKCCTQRFSKCLFAHGSPPGNWIWGWIFSRNVIQALFIVTVRQSKDPKTNLAQQVCSVEHCVFLYLLTVQKLEMYFYESLQLCTEYLVLWFAHVSICVMSIKL